MCYAPWYREFFDLNPLPASRRALVQAYAASKGKTVQAYLRGLFPSYWRACSCPGGDSEPGSSKSTQATEPTLNVRLVGPALGLSQKQEVEILNDLFATVLPQLRSSPEYQRDRDPRSLHFPLRK